MGFDSGSSAHFGGALSMVEVLVGLYGKIMNVNNENTRLETRDRFILSKGHGVLALYSILIELKFINEDMAQTYMKNESELIAHPIKNLDFGIESSNGSLGQGLSYACGLSIAAKLKSQSHRIFVILGDGECNEGLVWEAAEFAGHMKLSNLVVIVDCNGFQSDGSTDSIIENHLMLGKWTSFGWNAIEVDGHDIVQIIHVMEEKLDSDKPNVLLANTIKGKGISFMESNNSWHHNRLTESFYLKALEDLN